LAAEGVNVIVEEVLMTADEWTHWQESLASLDARWVGVRCPPSVVVDRERQRGDRWPGLAAGTAQKVHLHAIYDAEVDCRSGAPEDLAREVVSALRL
jgi:chloramphenicol 3-O phosphotransferase